MLDANNFGDYVLVSCSVCDVLKYRGSVYQYCKPWPAYIIKHQFSMATQNLKYIHYI